MEIDKVETPQQIDLFIKFPVELYKKDKNWIRPLNKDIEDAIFDPKENKLFRHGSIVRWLLYDQGKIVGRIAAFTNNKTLKGSSTPCGGVGYFECLNNQEYANKLFDTAKAWLREQGMEGMDGPINFGERDKWWGVLIKGFNEPNYCMPYNYPYYQSLFENYGFKLYFRQYTYHRKVNDKLPEKWLEKARRIGMNKKYSFDHIRRKNIDQYAEYFREVYNKAWVKHAGVSSMSSVQAKSILKQLKPILDERLIWFAFYEKQPVGFFIMLPELNQYFKHLNGKFNIWSKIKLMFLRWFKPVNKIFGVAFGIVPEHQKIGLEGAMVNAVVEKMQNKTRYTDIEMNWIGDFNPIMIHICESLGATVVKVHHTYRYLFDHNQKFERAPIIR